MSDYLNRVLGIPSQEEWNEMMSGLNPSHMAVYAFLAMEELEERQMHPSTQAILRYFTYDHLPVELRRFSEPICDLAHDYAKTLDGPELTAGLRKLLEAKDCFVRAAIKPPSLQKAIEKGEVEWCDVCHTPGGHHRLGCKNA